MQRKVPVETWALRIQLPSFSLMPRRKISQREETRTPQRVPRNAPGPGSTSLTDLQLCRMLIHWQDKHDHESTNPCYSKGKRGVGPSVERNSQLSFFLIGGIDISKESPSEKQTLPWSSKHGGKKVLQLVGFTYHPNTVFFHSRQGTWRRGWHRPSTFMGHIVTFSSMMDHVCDSGTIDCNGAERFLSPSAVAAIIIMS